MTPTTALWSYQSMTAYTPDHHNSGRIVRHSKEDGLSEREFESLFKAVSEPRIGQEGDVR